MPTSWRSSRGGSTTTNKLIPNNFDQLDIYCCEYLGHLFFEGFNDEVGDKLLAALKYA